MNNVSRCEPESTARPDEHGSLTGERSTSPETLEQALARAAGSRDTGRDAPAGTRYTGVSYLRDREVDFIIRGMPAKPGGHAWDVAGGRVPRTTRRKRRATTPW